MADRPPVAVDDRAAIAHLLRRATFGPAPGQVETLNAGGIAAALNSVLAATPPPVPADPAMEGWEPIKWWIARMADPAVGLHEKMTWYWHGHLTSSISKVGQWPWMWTQHKLIRDNALGNFRTLVQAITIDAAMLVYLDGDPSVVQNPNENYSRELMELFCLGIGNYTEADVKNGAKALAGYDVSWPDGVVTFYPEYALTTPVTYLGKSVKTAQDVVNAVVDHPACAPWISTKLYRFFVGQQPTAQRVTELATVFRNNNLEIKPLVEAILRDPLFLDPSTRYNRAKQPVEWVTNAFAAAGASNPGWATSVANDLGQLPFDPPSVAGWPGGTRWLAASAAFTRAALAIDGPTLTQITNAATPAAMVDTTLAQCSIYQVSPATRAALDAISNTTTLAKWQRSRILFASAVTSPEFALA
ncbi:MAG: DUF1800 domain-containing protein [Acidimicrobiia bacterium]